MIVCEECKHRVSQHSVNIYQSGLVAVRCFHNSYVKGRVRHYECECVDYLGEVIDR